MATSTAGTILKYSTLPATTYAKLIDIVTYPDFGSAPSKLDTSTLTLEKFKTSILGLQEIPDLTFECNFDDTEYAKVQALEGTDLGFQIDFGGSGTITWQGQVSIFIVGGGVDEVRKCTLTLSATTEFVFAVGT